MKQVIVIGGGPSGMIAAIMAARAKNKVVLIERNEKLGKKLFITGKGRCNITNQTDVETLMTNTLTNRKFLYSAFYTLDSYALMDFIIDLGLPLKVERGNRVFPASDKSSDLIKCFSQELEKQGVQVMLNTNLIELILRNNEIEGVLTDKGEMYADKVILATGGMSYSMTGSNGDGYKIAEKAGHSIVKLAPGLVPIETKEEWPKSLQGLSLKNVRLTVYTNEKNKQATLYEDFGEMLFTHFGISGPLVLSASSFLPKEKTKEIKIKIDLKPTLSFEQLDNRILRDFEKNNKKQFKNSLSELLPQKLIPVIIELSQIEENRRTDQITREERHRLVSIFKGMELTINRTRSFNEAIVTRGGIDIKEVNPNTMESKKIKGLYFTGEVLDLDALTGGFNLQIAFSTGYLAGIS